MAALLSILRRLFGGEPGDSPYKAGAVYVNLRRQILALTAERLRVPADQQVLALLMEMGYPEAVASLVAVMNGSASLYFSNGGGFIGAGQNPGPNAAARKLVAKAAEFQAACAPAKEFPFPRKGHTRFYMVTPTGVLTSEAREEELGNHRHPMSPLFHTAHELITQIRLSAQEKKTGTAK